MSTHVHTLAHTLVHSLANITPAPVTWLVPSLIPRGKVTLLSGPPGSGKSLFALHLAAALSQAPHDHSPHLPVTHNAPADVFILSAEDDCRDTIAPRLEVLGADRSRIHIIGSTEAYIFDSSKTVNHKPHKSMPRDPDGRAFRDREYPEMYGHDEDEEPEFLRRNLDLTDIIDMNFLTDAIRGGLNTSLLIIDSLASYLGHKTIFSHKAVKVVMDYLTDLAQRFNIAILVLCNATQPSRRSQLPRPMGSAFLSTIARSILTIQEDESWVPPRSAWGEPNKPSELPDPSPVPADPAPSDLALSAFRFSLSTPRLLTPLKTISSRLPAPIPFEITDSGLTFHPPRPPQPTKTDLARAMLQDLLKTGPKFLSREIYPAAEAHGVTKNPLFEAANQLKLVRTPHPQPTGRPLYTWSLPGATEKPRDCSPWDAPPAAATRPPATTPAHPQEPTPPNARGKPRDSSPWDEPPPATPTTTPATPAHSKESTPRTRSGTL